MSSGKLQEFRQHRLYKYLASLLIVSIATFIQHLLWDYIQPAPFLFFFPAVIFASIYGDGNFAIFLSILSAQYFFINPYYSLEMKLPGDLIRLLVFLFTAVTLRFLVKKLVEAKLKAEEAVINLQEEKEIREKFVSTLTHDLQTPLTSAKLSVQLLMRTPESESLQKNGERMVTNLNRIEHMIRDLLDTNKLRAGKKIPLTIIEMDISHCIRQTISELTTLHGDLFRIKAPKSLNGFWCEDAIRRILENLCNNAVKYGHENSPITIFIEENEPFINLKVHNLGDPILHHELDLMFRPFERLKDDNLYKKGWGLGLTLVKGLTEAQGGKVSVTSNKEGTTFIVSLPKDVRPFVDDKSSS